MIVALCISMILVYCLESCRTKVFAQKKLITTNKKQKEVVWKIDTIKLPEKREGMTQEEYRAYLQKFYQDNFNQLLSPEFKKLNDIITKQSETLDKQSQSLSRLTELYSSTRERNIHYRDSIQNVITALNIEIISWQKKFDEHQAKQIEQAKKQLEQNKQQINELNNITDILLAAGVTIGVAVVLLVIAVLIQSKRITNLYKAIEHE